MWRVEFRKSLGCVEYVFTGHNSGKDIQDATSRGIALGKQHQTLNYLVNLTELEFNGSIFSLLNMPGEQYVKEDLDRRSKIAVVLPMSERTKEDALFYETASTNRGWNVQSFESRSDALEWLHSDESS